MSPAPDVNAMLDRFRSYRQAAGLSLSAFALKAGLSRSALAGMDRDDWSPTADTLRALESVVGDWQPGEPVPEPLPAEAEASVPPVVQPDWQPAHAGDHKIEDRQ